MPVFGKILSFNEFIKTHNVEIPRIQRDYTYGSGNEKTEKVVEKLLSDIYSALTNHNPLILDFVYGSKNDKTHYEPLDGQQRITTLFLLHMFAAWKANVNPGTIIFRYATRDNTSTFCAALTDGTFKYDPAEGKETAQIRDCSFFLPSFNDDPSIISMLNVLDKIESKFSTLSEVSDSPSLWDLLTQEDCPIKFYCLDFGEFNEFKLSNDLYIKMNSRGKTLTDYEIFKSQIEKYIQTTLGDKDLMYRFAQLFDTDFTDLVWNEQGRDKGRIDNAFIWLFRNILSLINYLRKKNIYPIRNLSFIGDYLSGVPYSDKFDILHSWQLEKDDIEFILDFLGTFSDIHKLYKLKDLSKGSANDQLWGYILYSTKDDIPSDRKFGDFELIRTFKTEANVFRSACEGSLTHAEVIMLYAQYYAFKKYPLPFLGKDSIALWQTQVNPIRHLRNLLETSTNELRPENIAELLDETEIILSGNISSIQTSKKSFNSTQLLEEQNKALVPERWESLYVFENHDILRGALSLFSPTDSFNLQSDDVFSSVSRRLSTFSTIFNQSAKENDYLIRAELLSLHDFSQTSDSDVRHERDNRMLGRTYGSWREMFVKSDYYHQTNIMAAIDKYFGNGTPTILPLDTRDWRYYATQKDYYTRIYFSYNAPGYGYVFFIDADSKPLECYLLRSTSSYDDNVMWKLLNRVLWESLWHKRWSKTEQESSTLRDRKYWQGIDYCKKYVIDAENDGWRIYSDYQDEILTGLRANGFVVNDNLVLVPDNTDYIEYGLMITDAIKVIVPSIVPAEHDPEEIDV